MYIPERSTFPPITYLTVVPETFSGIFDEVEFTLEVLDGTANFGRSRKRKKMYGERMIIESPTKTFLYRLINSVLKRLEARPINDL